MLKSRKWLWAAGALLMTFAMFWLAACSKKSGLPAPPISHPINLSHAGVVAKFDFEVKTRRPCWFRIEFQYPKNNPVEKERIYGIVGHYLGERHGVPIINGVPTPIRLTITEMHHSSDVIVYQKEMTPTLSSVGPDSFEKIIGFHNLPPGKYAVVLESLASQEEYDSIPTSLSIENDWIK